MKISDLQPMDIIVTRDKTFLSWFIRVMSGQKWSHVCLAGENGTIYTTDNGFTLFGKKIGNGFSHVDAEQYLKGKTWGVYRTVTPLTEQQKETGKDTCDKMIGDDYDYLGLFNMFVTNLKGEGVPDDGTPYAKKCTETVLFVYDMMGVHLLRHTYKTPGGVTPGEFGYDSQLLSVA